MVYDIDYDYQSLLQLTLVGYGDIFPVTHLGRLVTLIAGIWGVFVLSLFVVTLNNITLLTGKENNAYEELVRRDNIKKYLYEDAVRIIQTYFRIVRGRRMKEDMKKRFLMRIDLMGMLNRFKIKRK